jgi:hypothetical protein
MEIVVKIGTRYPDKNDSRHMTGWRDGQIVDVGPDGAFTGTQTRKHFAILRVPGKYDPHDPNIKKLTTSAEGFKRLYYVDLTRLKNTALITPSKLGAYYSKTKRVTTMNIKASLDTIVRNEIDHRRMDESKLEVVGSESTGTFSIGSGLDYDTVVLFEADLAATLTGNVIGEHANEETACGSLCVFDSTTAADKKITLTAASSSRHDGTGYGNGARINMTSFDYIRIDTDYMDVTELAFDASGADNRALYVYQSAGVTVFDKLLIKGDASSQDMIVLIWNADGTHYVRNCIVYGGSTNAGISCNNEYSTGIWYIENNTVAKCGVGLEFPADTPDAGSITVNNNFMQGNTVGYSDPNSAVDSHADNITEDNSSPDEGRRSVSAHNIFIDYDNDNYLRASCAAGFSGTNLSARFDDDILGNIRDEWCIGAHEYQDNGLPTNNGDEEEDMPTIKRTRYYWKHPGTNQVVFGDWDVVDFDDGNGNHHTGVSHNRLSGELRALMAEEDMEERIDQDEIDELIELTEDPNQFVVKKFGSGYVTDSGQAIQV